MTTVRTHEKLETKHSEGADLHRAAHIVTYTQPVAPVHTEKQVSQCHLPLNGGCSIKSKKQIRSIAPIFEGDRVFNGGCFT